MRVIVYGMGAIGGIVAAALAHSGAEVIGIARGRMLEAVREKGLRLISPDVDVTVPVPVVGAPDEIAFRPDDAILLCMKTQDTLPALEALRLAGVRDQPVFCMQNSVANERMALRVLPNVHGITVMLPATYLTPGEVISYCSPKLGMFDIGRYPQGADQADEELAALLNAAGFAAFADREVMRSKHGKLLLNLGNISGAAHGARTDDKALRQALQAEAETVLAAAGIPFADVSQADPRRPLYVNIKPVPGQPPMSNSTLQSLQRGGGIETDYLNGEICLLGRLNGVPTPLNDAMMDLAARMLREGIAPGGVALEQTMAALGLGGR